MVSYTIKIIASYFYRRYEARTGDKTLVWRSNQCKDNSSWEV